MFGRLINKIKDGLGKAGKHKRMKKWLQEAKDELVDQGFEMAEMWRDETVGKKMLKKTFPSYQKYLMNAYKEKQDRITRRRNKRLRAWTTLRKVLSTPHLEIVRNTLREHDKNPRFKKPARLPKGRAFGTGFYV